MAQDFFLARQPILDRDGHLHAYELLFRSSQQNQAMVTDDLTASATVIHNAFAELGLEQALGHALGFINVDDELLFSDIIELLPAQRIVLEILETVKLTPEVIERVRSLKARGFRVALDDVTEEVPGMPELLPLIDVIKFDLLAIPADDLPKLVGRFSAYTALKLAEKVDSAEQYERCLRLGFNLFQGYFFARPKVMSGRQMSASEMLVMRLIGLCRDDDSPVEEIDNLFKQGPDLTVRLLRLVNSVGIGTQRKLHSVRDAITVLGRRHLFRWLQLLLFTGAGAQGSPLLIMAATRGKVMEELMRFLKPGNGRQADAAFMVGVLSLVDALFCKPMEECLAPLHLAPELQAAILHQEGELGRLLQLAIAGEYTPEDVERELAHWPELTPLEVSSIFSVASEWAQTLE